MTGILNLRDIAELTAASPHAPAPGRVFRSSQPFGWDADATMDFLHRQGIETIVDLRSEREAGRVPGRLRTTPESMWSAHPSTRRRQIPPPPCS